MRRLTSLVHAAILAALFGLAATSATAQQFYLVSKTQVFSQTSSAGSVPNQYAPFVFGVQAATNGTLTLPSGAAGPALVFVNGDNSYEIEQTFATKAALDAAFPSGTYRFTGAGISALSFNVSDAYPTANPAVVGGTWSNGLLVFPAGQAATITISTNSSYATAGLAGHMQIKVQSPFDNTVNIRSEIATQPIFGFTATQTPLTTQTIPANQMVAGRVFEVEVHFDTITSLDTTSVSGGGVVTIFSKTLQFYAVAQGATTPPPPVITTQPTDQTGVAGGSVTIPLRITVSGAGQTSTNTRWFFNGLDINTDGIKYQQGPNGLTINNLSAADVGSYSVQVVNAGGVVSSNSATVTLGTSVAPTFTLQPSAQTLTVASGSTVVLRAAAVGAPTPTYQWQRDGSNIAGATNATLVLSGATGATAASSGSYRVMASNGVGQPVTSTATPVNAITTADAGRLTNLSIRTTAGSGDRTLIVGFAINGTGTKPVLIRASGPALTQFGLTGVLADPVLTLSNGATVVATNDNWASTDATLMASLGAFAFAPGSKDAAIAATSLTPNTYSAQITGQGGGSGIALAELYDASTTFTATTPRLVNVSARTQVDVGSGVLIAGFNIGGSTARTVLIRGIGPALTGFGVGGALANPVLNIYNDSSAVIATNDDWGGDAQLTAIGTSVGAFSLAATPGSKDSMLLLTLQPGLYSAQVSGVSNTTGVALVEIYEVP